MALLKEGWEDDYYGNPSIFDTGCVGRLVNVHKLPDGRYNIVLEGLQRCQYMEDFTEAGYRRAKFSPLPYSQPALLDDEIRKRLGDVALAYLRSKKAHSVCKVIASQKLTDSILVNSLSAGLDLTTLEKQFLLESDHLTQQARRLIDLIKFKLADVSVSQEGEA